MYKLPPIVNSEQISYLENESRRLLQGCRITAADGTILYTPDGWGNYQALWTRDFTYMVENAGYLIPPGEVESCLRFLLQGQREDGAIPDRVRPDGVPVYAAGPEDHPLGEPNLDNGPFLVIAADGYLRSLNPERRVDLFGQWASQLNRGMQYVPRSPSGLVYNDPQRPHSPYGFTDTVCKTGELFIESILYWTASQRLANLYAECGQAGEAAGYRRQTEQIQHGLDRLWDETVGAFLAASQDCRQVDIWGNAYALWAGFPLGERSERVMYFLVENFDRYIWRGQVRHLLQGEYWQRLLMPVEPETYQNGAYWATASGWLAWAIAPRRPDLARQMFADLIADFKANGIYECVNAGYHKLDTYVASATNPLGAALRL